MQNTNISAKARKITCFIVYAHAEGADPASTTLYQLAAKLEAAQIEVIWDRNTKGRGGHNIGDYNGRIAINHPEAVDFVLVAGTKQLLTKYRDTEPHVVNDELNDVRIRISKEDDVVKLYTNKVLQRSVLPLLLDGDMEQSLPDFFHNGTRERFVYFDLRNQESQESIEHGFAKIIATMQVPRSEQCFLHWLDIWNKAKSMTTERVISDLSKFYPDRDAALSEIDAQLQSQDLPIIHRQDQESLAKIIPRNSYYIERPAQEKKVIEYLQQGRHAVIHGPGGSGKTQIASKLAYQAKEQGLRLGVGQEDYFAAVFWIEMDNEQSAIAGFYKVLDYWDVPHSVEQPLEVLLIQLQTAISNAKNTYKAKPWLMVLDNADSPERLSPAINEFIEECTSCYSLITSRYPNWPYPGVKLQWQMEPEKANELAMKWLEDKAPAAKEIADLATELGYYPLAIARACQLMRTTPSLNITNYLQALRERNADIKQIEAKHEKELHTNYKGAYHLAITSMVQVSLANMSDVSALQTAICAFLYSDHIPTSFMAVPVPQDIPQTQNSTAKSLLAPTAATLVAGSRGLLQEVRQDAVAMHRLVQDALRQEIKEVTYFKALEQCLQVMHRNFVFTRVEHHKKLATDPALAEQERMYAKHAVQCLMHLSVLGSWKPEYRAINAIY